MSRIGPTMYGRRSIRRGELRNGPSIAQGSVHGTAEDFSTWIAKCGCHASASTARQPRKAILRSQISGNVWPMHVKRPGFLIHRRQFEILYFYIAFLSSCQKVTLGPLSPLGPTGPDPGRLADTISPASADRSEGKTMHFLTFSTKIE